MVDEEVKKLFRFSRVFNPAVPQLLIWASEENNRIRAVKMVRVAERLEINYRYYYRWKFLYNYKRKCGFLYEVKFEPQNYIEI